MHIHKKNLEKQKEESGRALEEHKLREERFRIEKEKKARRKKKTIAITVVVLLILGSLLTYNWLSPGKYDNFAKCLTDKGAVLYGENFCQYTKGNHK